MSGVKIITLGQRRRRWSAEDKREMVEEAELPGISILYLERKYDVNPSQLFRWRRLMRQGALEAVGKEERVVSIS